MLHTGEPSRRGREGVQIRPDPSGWRGLLRHNTSARARRFRQELGLPTERPIIMTGHQAQFWHPGILAKYLAADAIANADWGGIARPFPVFLVVDQDRPSRITVKYPVELERGKLAVGEVNYERDRTAPTRSAPAGSTPPGFVTEGLRAIDAAMQRRAGERGLARRAALANAELMAPLLSEASRSAPLLFATELTRTSFFAELVQLMEVVPERCVLAYNAAAARYPDAGIRPLQVSEVQDRWELPLWHLPKGRPRRHVFAEDLPGIPREELAPKALFMTGLLRMAGCDLFIHGTGGGGEGEQEGGYDIITDEWLRRWLGVEMEEAARLAPVATVTATYLLPLEAPRPPTQAEFRRATWRQHHAQHHPGELGLEAMEQQRQALVAEIGVAAKPVRARLFLELHALLERYRTAHAAELASLRAEVEAVLARRGDEAILRERTWAFALYPPEVIRALAEEVGRAFKAV